MYKKIMLKKCIIFFFIYLKLCSCTPQSYVDFDISREKNIQRFPWMVIISSDDEKSMFAYGTLIHERAAVTLSLMESNEPSYFNFRVFAECYFAQHTLNHHCRAVRSVKEYNILKQFEDDSEGNLAVLILSKPFKLSEAINIIHFAGHDTDFDRNECAIIALKNLASSQGSQPKARLITSTHVKIISNPDNYMEYKLWLNNSYLTLYDDEGRAEKFKNETAKYLIDYSGGPVVCKHTHIENRWLLVGVINFAIIIRYDKLEYTSTGEITRVDVNDIHEIFDEIIKLSYVPGETHHGLNIGYK